jgi:hypothetical protein
LPSKDATLPLLPLVFPPLFYPGTPTVGGARTIAVRAGEERTGIDMQVRPVPSVRVSGTVIGPDGPAPAMSVRLRAVDQVFGADSGAIDVAVATSDANGAFTLSGVTPGQYLLKATGTTVPNPSSVQTPPQVLWASEPIAIGAADVTNFVVTLRPGMSISGRLQFAGSAMPPAAQVMRASVSLLPAAGGAIEPRMLGRNQIDASGRFATNPVPAGEYVLRVDAIGRWNMTTAIHAGRDVADAAIDLSTGDVFDVMVTMSDRQTLLSGPVVDPRGQSDGAASILVFPSDRASWSPMSRRFRAIRSDRSGTFATDGLPPGEYCVVAVHGAAGDWRDPRMLELLSRIATRVSLADGERRTVTLTSVARPAIPRGGNED